MGIPRWKCRCGLSFWKREELRTHVKRTHLASKPRISRGLFNGKRYALPPKLPEKI